MYLRLALIGDVASTNRVQGIRRTHGDQQSSPFLDRPVRDFEEHEAAFASFFAHEGAMLPDARQLETTARLKMGDYAYWYGLWQLIRRQPGASEAFKFSATHRSRSNLIPPISFLCKKRWLRSLRRAVRKATRKPQLLPPLSSAGTF